MYFKSLLSCTLMLTILHRIPAVDETGACDSMIFCDGPILKAVQEAWIFPDSKKFVDTSLKTDPDIVLAEFDALVKRTGTPSKADLIEFLQHNFNEPGNEFDRWGPPDWTERPNFLKRIHDPELKEWAKQLNGDWLKLTKKIKSGVADHPDRHSLIYVPNSFIIPGDRFKEYYYWDSYWIINGLLLSDMIFTARGMIINLLTLVERFGHVPNGGRIYFERRSQPPYLIPIMYSYHEMTGDRSLVLDNLDTLEREYMFWINNRSITIHKNDRSYDMTIYNVTMTKPRPEGYREDMKLAENQSTEQAHELWSHVASACESGWDFTARWFKRNGPKKMTLGSTKTRNIVPVDLNAIMYLNEKILAKFFALKGDTEKQEMYLERSYAREQAIYDLMWNNEKGAWFDYDIEEEAQLTEFYASNLVPMFAGNYGNVGNQSREDMDRKIIQYLKNEGVLNHPGGVPTSTVVTNEQWDWPNSWAPSVHMIVEGLRESSVTEAKSMAQEISRKWIDNNYLTWYLKGHMYEKYNASHPGIPGGGGEYKVQTGYGWTNSVVMLFLNRYGDRFTAMKLPEKSWIDEYREKHKQEL